MKHTAEYSQIILRVRKSVHAIRELDPKHQSQGNDPLIVSHFALHRLTN